jgi:branched-chain amino acid transport system ATP-binding protein
MTEIAARNVSMVFGGVHAVQDVTFAAGPGRIVGIIGPNGSGKTTMVNICTGLYNPTSGRLMIDGAPVTARGPRRATRVSRLGVSRTFQHPLAFSDLTVLENVMVGAESRRSCGPVAAILGLRGGRTANRAARELSMECLEMVGMAGHRDLPVDRISPGSLHFLEIARAMAMRPGVLFLDEPAAGLNAAETVALGEIIRTVRDLGVGVVLIEHDVQFVVRTCDEIMVMNFGQQIAYGAPDVITNDPQVLEAYLGTTGRSGVGLAHD